MIKRLVKKPYLITIFLILLLTFLLIDSVSVPVIGKVGDKGAMCAEHYCVCACYHPDAFGCECGHGETGWYFWCWSVCLCNDGSWCCEDPPSWSPEYPIRFCPKAK